MKKAIQIIAAAGALALGATTSYADCSANPLNLVANCSFATGDLTNWTAMTSDPGGPNFGVDLGTDPDGIAPYGDSQNQLWSAETTAYSLTLSQSIATVAQTTYLISFYLAQDTAAVSQYGNSLNVAFGSTTLGPVSDIPVQGYTEYSFMAGASGGATTLSLTLGNDIGTFLLDDVSVTTVPEPGSLALAGIGLLGAIGASRRRKA